jgi:predicted nicotinamide N-methyase
MPAVAVWEHGPVDPDLAEFIRSSTRLTTAALVPEIRLHLAEEPIRLWEMTEAALRRTGLPPPFWAFAWAGGQALARYVLDHPGTVRGRRVIDLATGSGLVAIAAAKAGAAAVTATDIDPLAITAAAINAGANDVAVTVWDGDVLDGGVPDGGVPDGAVPDGGVPVGGVLGGGVLGGAVPAVDLLDSDQNVPYGECDSRQPGPPEVVLAADVFYERDLAGRVMRFLERAHARAAATVLLGDLGRTYLPRSGLRELAVYDVPVQRALEDADVKRTAVWQPTW